MLLGFQVPNVAIRVTTFILILLLMSPVILYYTQVIHIVNKVDFPPTIHDYIVWSDESANASHLVDLKAIPWPDYKRPNISSNLEVANLEPFDIKLSPGQYATIEKLMEIFEEIMVSLKLQDQWFMGSGTLIGSVQHHDIIPWDEDVDLCTHVRYRPLIQKAFRSLPPLIATVSKDGRDKLFFKPFNKSSKVDAYTIGSHGFWHKPWAWPFIEIFYYREIGPQMAEEFLHNIHGFNMSDILPLTYRPFGKHWYPAPRKAVTFLQKYYHIKAQYCSSHTYSHALERITIPSYESCRSLMNKYAFVHRCPLPSHERGAGNELVYCDEYLVNGKGQPIHKVRVALSPEEIDIPFFTVKHESFKCPH